MNFGSSHVYSYESDGSGEEYISEEELKVGMYLSDDSDEQQNEQPTVVAGSQCKVEQAVDSNPLTPSFNGDEKPLMKDIDNHVVEKWATKWKELGSQLNIGEYAIRNIEYDYPNDCERCCRIMLSRWLEQTAHPTWGILISALNALSDNETVENETVLSVPLPPPPPPPAGSMLALLATNAHQCDHERLNWLKKGGVKGKITRQADTNVIAFKFNALTEPSHMHTGDAIVCSNKDCMAILSHLSKLKKNAETGAKTWECEFCGTVNVVELEPEEVPSKDDITFMIVPAPVNTKQGATGGVESLIIFCVDISGSMCVTTEVSGKFQLKGHSRLAELESLNTDGEDQYMPGQKRDVTYVSRLQCVQAAVDYQLSNFAKIQPKTKISLVTFNNEVTVFGDDKNDAIVVTGDKLNDNDALVKAGTEASLPASIRYTREYLSSKLFSLEETGSTALGPALIISIAMAARVPGSRVIVCTDGLANIGLGSLDEEQVREGQQFYEKLGTQAVDNGVIVSVVSIKGTECRLIELGQVASQTGGEVTIVDPLTLTKQFNTILANPIIATNVITKLILHKNLYFRHEDYQSASCVTIQVGNVTTVTELTYEYGVRSKKNKENTTDKGEPTIADTTKCDEQKQATNGAVGGGGATAGAAETKDMPTLKIDGKECLPFQLQISYNSMDRAQCNRVITQVKPMTKDRQVAEAGSNVQVLGAHVAKTTAKMALEGEYTKARTTALAAQRLVQRVGHVYKRQDEYRAWVKNVAPMENVMRESQKSEFAAIGCSYSDEEEPEDDDIQYTPSTKLSPTVLKKKKQITLRRFRSCEDLRSNFNDKDHIIQDNAPIKMTPKVVKEKAHKRRDESSDAFSEMCYKNMVHMYV